MGNSSIDRAIAAARSRRRVDPELARFLRRKAGVPLRVVADELGVSTAAVSHWERLRRVPSDPRLVDAYAGIVQRLADELSRPSEDDR